jgi:uncharacterized membrane protein
MSKNRHVIKNKILWWVLASGSLVGLLASFIQTIERINYAKNPTVPLKCDVSAIFSCSNVFDAWQSSVFGFSNSLMCIVFFSITFGVALAGATSTEIRKALRLWVHFFAIFFLGFGAWYLWQSAYEIGYICIFCAACYGAVIAMNWAWLRLNAQDIFRSKSAKARWQRIESSGADTFGWILWAVIIAGVVAAPFIN